MDYSLAFSIAGQITMLGWILLAIVPRWKYTKTIVQNGIIPLLLGSLYLYLFIRIVSSGGLDLSAFGSLDGVMELFTDPGAVLMGWVHYLSFDLWVGSWEVGDAHKKGVPHLLVIPCMFLTFMAGPVGLLLYILIRAIYTKQINHENF